jgi:hypothetical protein
MDQVVYEFLTKPRRISKKIMRLEARRTELMSCMLPSGIRYDLDKVQTSPDDPMVRMAGEVDEIERQIKALQQKRWAAVNQISDMIESLPDEDEKTLLMLKWIKDEKIEDIRKKMHYSKTAAYQIYNNGMKSLEIKLGTK